MDLNLYLLLQWTLIVKYKSGSIEVSHWKVNQFPGNNWNMIFDYW